MASQTRTRNYTTEKENGQLELWRGLEIVREERLKDTFDILQLAQIFVFCSLPYRPTDERQISHTARLGDGSTVEVIFTAMRPDVSIAFGNDRGLLYWLIDKAIREGTPHISWDHASEYLAYSGQGKGGRNRELLRERFLRIASTAITVVRKSGVQEDQAIMPIIRRISLPASITGKENIAEKLDRRKGRTSFGLQFDEDFVKDFMTHRVPVLRSLVVATEARPQMQDCMFFLIWRSYSAASESCIEWDKLRDQFWQGDSNRSRIRKRFEEAISLIRTTWPELRAEARSKGLWIGPPKHGVQFVPQLERPKHIKEAEARDEAERKRRQTEEMLKGLMKPKQISAGGAIPRQKSPGKVSELTHIADVAGRG